MGVKAITADYHGDMKDSVEKFHGNQLLGIAWSKHLMYATPLCIPVPPSMPFGVLVEKVLPGLYGQHPDFAKVDWRAVTWTHSGEAFIPDPEKSLTHNGIGHKSLIRFSTPGLDGLANACF